MAYRLQSTSLPIHEWLRVIATVALCTGSSHARAVGSELGAAPELTNAQEDARSAGSTPARASGAPGTEDDMGSRTSASSSDSGTSHWGGWLTMGAGPLWGDSNPSVGIRGPSWAFAMTVNASYLFLYVGAGWKLVSFHDEQPLRQQVVDYPSGENLQTLESSAVSLDGHLEFGLTHRFLVSVSRSETLSLHPTLGVGTEGITSPQRAPGGTCIDCQVTYAAAYHAGRYFRIGVGFYLAQPLLNAKAYVFVGVAPSYQYYWGTASPRLTGYLDIPLSIGFGS